MGKDAVVTHLVSLRRGKLQTGSERALHVAEVGKAHKLVGRHPVVHLVADVLGDICGVVCKRLRRVA